MGDKIHSSLCLESLFQILSEVNRRLQQSELNKSSGYLPKEMALCEIPSFTVLPQQFNKESLSAERENFELKRW